MKMKLLFISPSFYPATYYGGPIYSTYELAKALAANGIEVNVVTTNANGHKNLEIKTNTFLEVDKNLFVKYYGAATKKGFSPFMFLFLWKDFLRVDIVYLISVFSPPTPLTMFLNLFFRKQIIISPRGQLGKWCLEQGNKFKKLWLHAFIQPFITRLYWHLTSVEEEKNVLTVFPKAKTFVIPNGIKIDRTVNKEKKKDKLFYKKYTESINEKSKVIISMGRMHNVKGFDILIDAFSQVLKQFDDIILFIAGKDFGERKNIEHLINEVGLCRRVFLVGFIEGEEKWEFLKNADVFALPSHHENFGMVYGEALAAGTPIIASKNTPWQDVEKYNCGKWVENTPDKFAEAITEILNSDNVQMGLNGRKYIQENFSWEKIAVDFKRQIDKIMSVDK